MLKRIQWMLLSILFIMPLCTTFASSDPNDAAGSKDPDIFTRMPGFHIYNYQVRDFDRFEFPVSPDKTEKVEGRYIFEFRPIDETGSLMYCLLG
jgi:hypothetical protein